MALLWVVQQQRAVTDLHPANAEETGGEVFRGALRYPSDSGGWQLGDVDLSEHLDKYRDREIVLIIASVGEAGKEQVICGVCGFVLDGVGECPRCKLMVEETARGIEERQEMREALFTDVEEILGYGDE